MRSLLLLLLLLLPLSSSAQSWNVRTGPIDWVLGANGKVDYKFAPQWTVELNFFALDNDVYAMRLKGLTLGALVAYSFNEAFVDSWMLEAGVASGQLKATAQNPLGGSDSQSFTNTSAMALAGYHWFWLPFNITLAGGLMSNSGSQVTVRDRFGNSDGQVPLRAWGFTADATIGLAF